MVSSIPWPQATGEIRRRLTRQELECHRSAMPPLILQWKYSSFHAGVESTDVCVHSLSSPSTQLSNWSRRQTGPTPSAAQHSLGHDLPCRDSRGTASSSSLLIPYSPSSSSSSLSGSCSGFGEEPGSDGLHQCGESTQSHSGVPGGMEYGEPGGDSTLCHTAVSLTTARRNKYTLLQEIHACTCTMYVQYMCVDCP